MNELAKKIDGVPVSDLIAGRTAMRTADGAPVYTETQRNFLAERSRQRMADQQARDDAIWRFSDAVKHDAKLQAKLEAIEAQRERAIAEAFDRARAAAQPLLTEPTTGFQHPSLRDRFPQGSEIGEVLSPFAAAVSV